MFNLLKWAKQTNNQTLILQLLLFNSNLWHTGHIPG